MNKIKSKLVRVLTFVLISIASISYTWAVESTKVKAEPASTFEIRADGLACPYCAYGIEKKFMAINGVQYVDVNLEQGKVLVTGDANLTFKEQQLKTLFNDSGFTYRTMKKIANEKASNEQ